MNVVIIAPEYRTVTGPLIFLAGPITGAPDWQQCALEYLQEKSPITVASPRRPQSLDEDFDPDEYIRQIEWEHTHLDRAAENGVTLFWLPKAARDIPGRPYAQTTRFELGEAIARHYLRGTKLVVGIEPGFPGQRYIVETMYRKAFDVPVAFSLQQACDQALHLLNEDRSA